MLAQDIIILAHRNCYSKHDKIKYKNEILCRLEYQRLYEKNSGKESESKWKLLKEKTKPRNEEEKKMKQNRILSHSINLCLNLDVEDKHKIDIINVLLDFGDYEYFPPIKEICQSIFYNYMHQKKSPLIYLFPVDTETVRNAYLTDEIPSEDKEKLHGHILFLLKKNLVLPSKPNVINVVTLCLIKSALDLKITNSVFEMTNEECEMMTSLYSLDLKFYPISSTSRTKKDILLKLKVIGTRKYDGDDTCTQIFANNKHSISNKIVKVMIDKAAEYVKGCCSADEDGGNQSDIYLNNGDLQNTMLALIEDYNDSVGLVSGLQYRLDVETEFRKEFERKRSENKIQKVNKKICNYNLNVEHETKAPFHQMKRYKHKKETSARKISFVVDDDPLFKFIVDNLSDVNSLADRLDELELTKYEEYREKLMNAVSNYDTYIDASSDRAIAFDMLTSFLDTFKPNKKEANKTEEPAEKKLTDDLFQQIKENIIFTYEVIIDQSKLEETKDFIGKALDYLFEYKIYNDLNKFKEIYEQMLVMAEIYTELDSNDDKYKFPKYIIPPLPTSNISLPSSS